MTECGISNSKHITFRADKSRCNSPLWMTHAYDCDTLVLLWWYIIAMLYCGTLSLCIIVRPYYYYTIASQICFVASMIIRGGRLRNWYCGVLSAVSSTRAFSSTLSRARSGAYSQMIELSPFGSIASPKNRMMFGWCRKRAYINAIQQVV